MKLNHNTLAFILPSIVTVGLFILVYLIPEIGFAPQETTGKILLKVALFTALWPLALRFLGGWGYSVTKNAKDSEYGMTLLATAVIVGLALVIAAK